MRCAKRIPGNLDHLKRCTLPWSAHDVWSCIQTDPALGNLTLDELHALETQTPAPSLPNRSLTCDPHFWAQQIERTAAPGTPDDVKFGAVRKALELYGCIAPQPASPPPPQPAVPQITNCQWVGGDLTCITY
jgi:hypothetical protein